MKRAFLILVLCGLAITTSVAAQTAAWRRYGLDGLTLEVPPDWAPSPHNPWVLRARTGRATVNFGRWQPIRSSWYEDFDEWTSDWLDRSRGAFGPLKFRRRKVSGFDALTYWHTSFASQGQRDTWIAVPDPGLKRGGSIYSFSLGTSDPQMVAVYERMLNSISLDARVLSLGSK